MGTSPDAAAADAAAGAGSPKKKTPAHNKQRSKNLRILGDPTPTALEKHFIAYAEAQKAMLRLVEHLEWDEEKLSNGLEGVCEKQGGRAVVGLMAGMVAGRNRNSQFLVGGGDDGGGQRM